MNKHKILLLQSIVENRLSGQESLRDIAKIIGCEDKPQIVKFHMSSLLLAGFVTINKNGKYIATKDAKKLFDIIQENKTLFEKIEKLYSHKDRL